MKKINYIFILVLVFLISACSESSDRNENLDPLFVSASPTVAQADDIITILGRHLSNNIKDIKVTINGNQAIVLEASTDKILVVVPKGEGVGRIIVDVNGVKLEGSEFSYIAQSDKIYYVSRLAGQPGINGTTDGFGSEALFKHPSGLAFSLDSSLIYITDRSNNAIRSITPKGQVTTVVPGSLSAYNFPWQGAFDSAGNYYVADKGGHRIQKLDTSGNVTTFAGGTGAGSTEGNAATAKFNNPMSVIIDKEDNIYVSDRDNKKIRKITPAGVVSTYATLGTASPNAAIFDKKGNLIVATSNTYTLLTVSPDGTVSVLAGDGTKGNSSYDGEEGNLLTAKIGASFGINIDKDGKLYIADYTYHTIRIITPDKNGDLKSGKLETIAGNGKGGSTDGVGLSASFNGPHSILPTANGRIIYVADAVSYIIRKIEILD